jgi:hypothetical protein
MDVTPEDYEIIARVMDCVTDEQYIKDNNVDARAMAAISMGAESIWRVAGKKPLTPAQRVWAYGDTGMRESMERIAGGPLL